MQCCEEKAALVRLFYNISSSFLLLFILFYLTFNLLAKILHLCGSPIFNRSEDAYQYATSSDEEEEEELGTKVDNLYFHGYEEKDHLFPNVINNSEGFTKANDAYFHEYEEKDHLLADVINNGDALQFISSENIQNHSPHVSFYEEPEEDVVCSPVSESEVLVEVTEDENSYLSCNDSESNFCEPFTDVASTPGKNGSAKDHKKHDEDEEKYMRESKLMRDENFLISAKPKSESKRLKVPGKIVFEEEIYGDTYTIGSTSKDSSEWRSSINCRDYGTEDPFSSSSRRSCPKWESYTVFQKYDEEMLYLDRISVQKLHETESFRSIQACPRSISGRIVHKLVTRNRTRNSQQNPFHELEAAYVAQICLTWEALNWNYKYFQRLRASRQESDPGCPAYVAQQFQQFLVLLQRYVETEPYEYGRRPEIYAKMRSKAAKLLQVPEYRDSIDDEKEGIGSRIPSSSFLAIMEESIITFMRFLKADMESHCQMLASFFKRNRRDGVDPTRLLFLKKVNKKKKLKLKDFRRSGKCISKRKLEPAEEMEVLMALIDMKVVSRVLRMTELSEDQLSWCDNKMSKVRVGDGKMQRESSPLFFPAH